MTRYEYILVRSAAASMLPTVIQNFSFVQFNTRHFGVIYLFCHHKERERLAFPASAAINFIV